LTKAIVDGLCAGMKEVFPTLPVGPTHDHRDFEPDKSYRVCDFMLKSVPLHEGDVTAFRDAGLAVAQRDGHKIAFSMNILDGSYRVEDVGAADRRGRDLQAELPNDGSPGPRIWARTRSGRVHHADVAV
jgi:hypothetical protein